MKFQIIIVVVFLFNIIAIIPLEQKEIKLNSIVKNVDTSNVSLECLAEVKNEKKDSSNLEKNNNYKDTGDNKELEFLKIWIPAGVSLFVLMVTNFVTLWKIKKETSESLKKELVLTKISHEKEKLEKFYDPIYAILSTNSEIFNSFGPRSFPEEEYSRNEAATIWNKMVKNIILPNNRKIGKIISNYSHLIDYKDDLSLYLEYLKHLESYKHFVKYPNALHKQHKYPLGFLDNVAKYRKDILENLLEIEKKLGNY